jgi:alpha-tubulin suppressor-like RCC1 family protein
VCTSNVGNYHSTDICWHSQEITAFSKKIKSLVAGRESSYFLFDDGTVSSCGRNNEGQLGDGTFVDNKQTSVLIPDNDIIVGLGSGPSSNSAFFIGKKAVYGTGANDRNQLGLGEAGKTKYPTAVKFESGLDIVGISSSGTHTVASNLITITDAPTRRPSSEPTKSRVESKSFMR